MTLAKRSLLQRAAVLVGLVVLSVVLFYIGKGHTLLIDTHAITIDGQELSSAETVNVSIDGKEPESMGRAERILVNVAGPRHTISIEVVSGEQRRVEQQFTLPTFIDSPLLSIPAILHHAPATHWLSTFVPEEAEEAAAEQIQHQEDAPTSDPSAGDAPSTAKP